jgi:flagella basal body P-ring formation protein FlgA
MQRYLLILICLISLTPAWSENIESIENIKEITKKYIIQHTTLDSGETLEVQINSTDVPMHLSKCSNEIQVAFPKESTREKINSVELTCSDNEKTWHSYVPVNVQIFTRVVVAKHPIGMGSPIVENDIDYANANINHLYTGYFTEIDSVKGYVSAQLIGSGTVISKKNVRRQQLVHKNQPIDLVVRKNAIEITMKGIAKSDGVLNDTIAAYNPSSKKTMEAIVIGFNKAEVVS